MLKPIWIGRFQVKGARDHKLLNGYSNAYLWVASQAENADQLKQRVQLALKENGLTVTSGERVELITDDSGQSYEIKKLVRDARRNPDSVACGVFQGFEDHAGRRPMLLRVETERLLLRPWEPRDRAPFAVINADRVIMSFMPRTLTRPQSDETVDHYLSDAHKTGFGYLAAELRPRDRIAALTGGIFAGMMGLRVMVDVLSRVPQPAVELGFRVAREYQRQGLATEGGRALIKLAFEEFQLPEIFAITSVDNVPARRLLEKLGLKHRPDFDFTHTRYPVQHLYARHTLYQISKPGKHSGIRKALS
jgi:RimJ/RimL family protein N-acetyltransferase